MRSLKEFDIPFIGLKLGEHVFDYQLDTAFFDHFEYRDFNTAKLKARVEMLKKENSLELFFRITGSVNLPCDITNELFDLPLDDEMRLVIKFGEEYDDTQEEVLILPQGEHRLNIAQYLYELTVRAVPLKRVSPAVQKGEKGQKIREQLTSERPEEALKEEIDPRWDKLKDLLN
ncbi:MAG: DUF177 domain-containing protein [Owenweeksia sp.]|nr:DUF177 domain-containing protein [Owenweeksia sp.]